MHCWLRLICRKWRLQWTVIAVLVRRRTITPKQTPGNEIILHIDHYKNLLMHPLLLLYSLFFLHNIGWEIEKSLQLPNGKVFDKDTFGSLDLAHYLLSVGCEEVELVGVCTDICVISNALLIKAYLPDFFPSPLCPFSFWLTSPPLALPLYPNSRKWNHSAYRPFLQLTTCSIPPLPARALAGKGCVFSIQQFVFCKCFTRNICKGGMLQVVSCRKRHDSYRLYYF